MSILEDLYNGAINPSEMHIKDGSEYQKLSGQLLDHIEELLPMLNTKEKLLYASIEEKIAERSNISEREAFIEGFRIGALIIYEIIHYKSTNFR